MSRPQSKIDNQKPEFENQNLSTIRRRLLSWFNRNSRDLPWRRDRDPYHIWISEIMLQQTQVATVIPYYERFLKALPTLANLAAADEAVVLRLWEGLGYYRRARHLHQAARLIAKDYHGELPSDPQDLSSLPGMGRYTVGAVLSQAFDCRLPILEANSQRVLCRLFGLDGDPRRNPLRNRLWEMADRLLPRRGAGQFNQALMELGALRCSPSKPRCSECPLAGNCVARKKGLQETIPRRNGSSGHLAIREIAVIVRRGERVLLVLRPQTGRWAGMWEFPHGETAAGESPVDGAIRLAHELTGLRVKAVGSLLKIRHSVTRYRITIDCVEARYCGGTFCSTFYQEGKWVKPEQLQGFLLSAPQRRIAQKLLDAR